MIQNVAVVEWRHGDGLARNLQTALFDLGYHTTLYIPGNTIPAQVDLIFSFGPYGSLFSITDWLAKLPKNHRPTFIHWDIEGMPDLRLPSWIVPPICDIRLWISQYKYSTQPLKKWISKTLLYKKFDSKLGRYRNFAEYHYLYKMGFIDGFYEFSFIYANAQQHYGLPAHYIPWGTSRLDYEVMELERDIDVLWLGQRHGRRRTQLVNIIKRDLHKHGYKMLVIDGIENPYIYGNQRTILLNRSKITLNLLPYWDFNNFPHKFHLAAPNRSLVVSEPFLEHVPEYKAGFHYIQSPVDQIVETIIYYLNHKEERKELSENAYHFSIDEMTLPKSISKIIQNLKRPDNHVYLVS